VTGPARWDAVGAVLTAPSPRLPQAWHSPHRPTHLGVSQPHSEHRYVDRARLVAPEPEGDLVMDAEARRRHGQFCDTGPRPSQDLTPLSV
jgi:hypothetical protein